MAAPTATHSSGLMPLKGSLPVAFFTASCTAGMRVEPPTRMTLSMSLAVRDASESAWRRGLMVSSTRSAVSSLNLARVRVTSRCLGPEASMVMKGWLMFVLMTPESSILAFSAASFRRCMAWRSLDRSMPSVRLNSATR